MKQFTLTRGYARAGKASFFFDSYQPLTSRSSFCGHARFGIRLDCRRYHRQQQYHRRQNIFSTSAPLRILIHM